jgi:uncharacterized protein YlzI (FlbEa/FlbD family)
MWPKKVVFTLESNTSDKNIDSTVLEYFFPAYDFRIITVGEDVLPEHYSGGFSGGFATYRIEEVSIAHDTTTTLTNDKLQLIIPSYDELMSRLLSFMDKTAKMVEIRYKRNDNFEIYEAPKATNKTARTHDVRIIKYSKYTPAYRTYDGVSDIDTFVY